MGNQTVATGMKRVILEFSYQDMWHRLFGPNFGKVEVIEVIRSLKCDFEGVGMICRMRFFFLAVKVSMIGLWERDQNGRMNQIDSVVDVVDEVDDHDTFQWAITPNRIFFSAFLRCSTTVDLSTFKCRATSWEEILLGTS